MHQQSNIDFFPKWLCPGCNAENDITNPVRCWKCNNKKPTSDEWKKIKEQKKEDKIKEQEDLIASKKAAMKIDEDVITTSSHIDAIPNVEDSKLEFDLTKLKKEITKV